jgi:hypothetical protein
LAAKVLRKETFILQLALISEEATYFTCYDERPQIYDIVGMIAGVPPSDNIELVVATINGWHNEYENRQDIVGKRSYKLREVGRLKLDRETRLLQNVPESRILCVFRKCNVKKEKTNKDWLSQGNWD